MGSCQMAISTRTGRGMSRPGSTSQPVRSGVRELGWRCRKDGTSSSRQAEARSCLPHIQIQLEAACWPWLHPGGAQAGWSQQEVRTDHRYLCRLQEEEQEC